MMVVANGDPFGSAVTYPRASTWSHLMMAPTRKLFTIEEANALIPFLQKTLDALQRQVRDIIRLKRQLEVLNLICDGHVSRENVDFQEYLQKTALYHQLIGQADALIRDVRMRGCLLRDVHTGIVDFYAEMEGRVVFLCWRRGEPGISYWHPVGEGYGQRRSIAGLSS
jgi:hypothetical protein